MPFPSRASASIIQSSADNHFPSLQNPGSGAIIGPTIGGAVARGVDRKPKPRSVRKVRVRGQAPESLLNILLSRLDVGVLALDRHGKILNANPAWWGLLRLPRRQLSREDFRAAFPRPL